MSNSKQSGSLRRYILTRIALAVPMVLILLILVFVMMRVAPGDPISSSQGGKLNATELAARRHAAGFDAPLYQQFWDYLKSVVTLNFGTTFSDRRSVRDIIIENGGATLTLTAGALVFAAVIGIPVGLLAGRYRDSAVDVISRMVSIVSYASPVFVTAPLLMLAFGTTSGQASPLIQLNVPTQTHILLLDAALNGDWNAVGDIVQHLLLPSIALGLLILGVFIRMIRINLIQSLQGDYIEAARARGVHERHVVARHGFRNALVPVITVLGLQVAMLLGGAVLTEQIFNWPGIGRQLIDYINQRDYVAVQGIVTVFALAVVVISLLIDFVNALIDPRVRY
ncbi:MAG: ABC transporter permease [Streptomyces sp.]|nr:ABC transporter permease [Streptomyces sp.]